MNLSKEHRIAKHKDFLKANWKLIAAFAWENYRGTGRGAVLVPEEDFIHAETPQLKGLRFHYLAAEDSDAPPFHGILSEKEVGWLESYDPDARAVVCIIRDGGGVSSYLIGGRARPSEAFASQKAEKN
jgi:hypothetical protein